MTNKRNFNPIANTQAGYGSMAIGENGEVLYKAFDVQTGEPVTVILFTDVAFLTSFIEGMKYLTSLHKEYAETHEQHFTAADLDFQQIMAELKKGTLH